MAAERGRVKLYVGRGGSASELRQFLADIEDAYIALARMELSFGRDRIRRRLVPFWVFERGWSDGPWSMPSLLPNERLQVTAVQFSSPGAWDFTGVPGALKEIREYLKDRDERRKDKEWRETGEKTKLELENDLLRERLHRERIGGLRERIDLLREAGIPEDEIQRLLWHEIGLPLSKVGRHQDTGLLTDQSEADEDQ